MPDDVLHPDQIALAASEIASEQRSGAGHSFDELDRRLGMPEGFFAVAVAVWSALQQNRPVMIIPNDNGVRVQ